MKPRAPFPMPNVDLIDPRTVIPDGLRAGSGEPFIDESQIPWTEQDFAFMAVYTALDLGRHDSPDADKCFPEEDRRVLVNLVHAVSQACTLGSDNEYLAPTAADIKSLYDLALSFESPELFLQNLSRELYPIRVMATKAPHMPSPTAIVTAGLRALQTRPA